MVLRDDGPKKIEYNSERDMDRFWSVATRLRREPAKQVWFLPGLILVVVLSVPWYRTGGEIGEVVGGLPLWVWTGLACALGVSVITGVGAVVFWQDDEVEDVSGGGDDE